jgi:serine/threonine protein kinase
MVINHDLTSEDLFSTLPRSFLSTWDFRVAFIDFEFATRYAPGSDTSTWIASGFCGNIGFAAPENIISHTTRADYAVLPADVRILSYITTFVVIYIRHLDIFSRESLG